MPQLNEIAVFADDALVEHYQGGFVQRFHRDSICVVQAFWWALGEPLKGNIGKLQITAFGAGREEQTERPLVLWLKFDFAAYVAGDHSVKRRLLGGLILRGLQLMAETGGWDPARIEAAYAKAAEVDFLVRRRIRKRWTSPNKQRRIEVDVTFDIDKLCFDAVVSRRAGRQYVVERTLHLGDAIPTEFAVREYTNGARWLSDDEFCMESDGYPPGKMCVKLTG